MTREPTLAIPEILRRLESRTGRFQPEAVGAAIARQEEITPELLRILDDVVRNPGKLDGDDDYLGHFYAMYLLAQFREVRAYPILIRLASLPGDVLDSLCGDFITEDLGRVLASVCGGELGPIQSLIENEDADEWIRSAALSSLVALVATGQKSRQEILGYFAELFRTRLPRQWSHAWDSLVSSSSDLYPAEVFEDIKRAYQEDLIDPTFIDLDDVGRDLALGKDQVLARLAADPNNQLVNDTVVEMLRWSSFRDDGQVRNAPKPGRNEPCPCGSGKKYKKCCLG